MGPVDSAAREVYLRAAPPITVATELAAATGLPLFHNHLTVDLVAALREGGFEAVRWT